MSDTLLDPAKFRDPLVTAKGEKRAHVAFNGLETLWVNTGTLCNIECVNCYIESSPTNDRLVYLTATELQPYLAEARDMGAREIGFTGGEPFMNPDMGQMLEDALAAGFEVLVLTNAMKPMMRPAVQEYLLKLLATYGEKLTLRVSLDHYAAPLHDEERGAGSFESACTGLRWLARHGFKLSIAGRTCWGEDEAAARPRYETLLRDLGVVLDVTDPGQLVLFPEMDETADVAEITVDCWDILKVDPAAMMCASQRMLVKRKGAAKPVVLPCTLLAYDEAFEMGSTLKGATGGVSLNHPHCAKFCVLGGGSCTADQ
ncbi:MAG: radical SAM protein [Alphaproteobacteria bacterium]